MRIRGRPNLAEKRDRLELANRTNRERDEEVTSAIDAQNRPEDREVKTHLLQGCSRPVESNCRRRTRNKFQNRGAFRRR